MSHVLMLPQREMVPELMDDPALDAALHRQALAGLERINRVSGTVKHLWATLERELPFYQDRPLGVLDVACGGGDIAVGLSAVARRRGRSVIVDGCDASDEAVRTAQQRAADAGEACRFFQMDALTDDWPRARAYDAVVCSLFLHHLTTEQVGPVLRRMAEAAPLVIADDLVRSRRGLVMAWLGTRALSRSRIVHVDGPRSVRAALTPGELTAIAHSEGLEPVTITRHFPSRMQMVWRRR